MKIFLSISAAVALLTTACSAQVQYMTWQNQVPWYGPDGVTPIAPGGLVQLIADGGDGLIVDPILHWCGTPEGDQLILEWLNAGCPPVGPAFHPELGDDFLVDSVDAPNPTYFINYGPGWDGYFDGTYIQSDSPPGTLMYTRFFTSGNPGIGDYYGTVGDVDGTTNDGITPNYGFFVLTDAPFPLYIFKDPYIADTLISTCPEPGTMLIAGAAILLGVVKMKSRAVSL